MNTLETHPIVVTGDSFAADVLKASHQHTVLVDFWAAWCGPCKALTGPLDEIAAERTGRATVAKIDVDAYPDLAAHFQVRSIPTLVLFRHGKAIEMLVGIRSKAEILRHLDAVDQPAHAATG
jgi:thioredoxin